MLLRRTSKAVDDRKWDLFQEWSPELPKIFNKDISPLNLFTLGEFFELVMNSALKTACDELNADYDPLPVVRLTAGITHSWLLTDVNMDYPYIVNGFCDLGSGVSHEGCVDLIGLLQVQSSRSASKIVVPVEKDQHFVPKAVLSQYVKQILQGKDKSLIFNQSTDHPPKNNLAVEAVIPH